MTMNEQFDVRAKLREEQDAIRALLESAGGAVAARLANVNKLTSQLLAGWNALPPEQRGAAPPSLLTDPLPALARGGGTGLAVLRAALAVVEAEDSAAAARAYEERQKAFEIEQEKQRQQRRPELDKVMKVETYKMGSFSPKMRPYDGA